MLLTEGWDCPSVDCIVVLRPTKVRSLYSQMVGRGTRLFPGKDHLLLLDFLWHTERHELCHPASLICQDEEVARKMTENIEKAGCPMDIEEAVLQMDMLGHNFFVFLDNRGGSTNVVYKRRDGKYGLIMSE